MTEYEMKIVALLIFAALFFSSFGKEVL